MVITMTEQELMDSFEGDYRYGTEVGGYLIKGDYLTEEEEVWVVRYPSGGWDVFRDLSQAVDVLRKAGVVT